MHTTLKLLTGKEEKFAKQFTLEIVNALSNKTYSNLNNNDYLVFLNKKFDLIPKLPLEHRFPSYVHSLEEIYSIFEKNTEENLLVYEEIYDLILHKIIIPFAFTLQKYPLGFLKIALDENAEEIKNNFQPFASLSLQLLIQLKTRLLLVADGKKVKPAFTTLNKIYMSDLGRSCLAYLLQGDHASARKHLTDFKSQLQKFVANNEQDENTSPFFSINNLCQCVLAFRETDYLSGQYYFKKATLKNIYQPDPKQSSLTLIARDLFDLSIEIIEYLLSKNNMNIMFYVHYLKHMIDTNKTAFANLKTLTESEIKIKSSFEKTIKDSPHLLAKYKKIVFDDKLDKLNKIPLYASNVTFSIDSSENEQQESKYNLAIEIKNPEYIALLITALQNHGVAVEQRENTIIIQRFLDTPNYKIERALSTWLLSMESQLQLSTLSLSVNTENNNSENKNTNDKSQTQNLALTDTKTENSDTPNIKPHQKIKTHKPNTIITTPEPIVKSSKIISWGNNFPTFNRMDPNCTMYKLTTNLPFQKFYIHIKPELLYTLQRNEPATKISLEKMCERGITRFTSSKKGSIEKFKGIILFSDKLDTEIKPSIDTVVGKIKNPTKDARYLGFLAARKTNKKKIYSLIEFDTIEKHNGAKFKF